MSSEHFENLWEKSEEIAIKYYDESKFDIIDIISEIRKTLLLIHPEKKGFENQETIGIILFYLTFLSKKLNVNTYAALKDHVEDIKIDMLELDNDDT